MSLRMALTSVRRTAVAARSGLRRYPRELVASLRSARRISPGRVAGAAPDLSCHELAAVWLGHATTLLRIGGLTVLTDPVFSNRIGMSVGGVTIGLPRLMPSPLGVEGLPPIDLILISHAHFDHLDKPTLRRLASPRTTVVTARRTARLIPRGFAGVVEMDWHDGVRVGEVELSAVRPAHWGARAAFDRRRGYNSYVLRAGRDRVLYAGDTAYTDAFDRLGGVSLAIMGIGSYDPWEHAHATPEQVWTMFRAMDGARLLPIHHSTFALGDEPPGDPMRRLLSAAGHEAGRVVLAEPGTVWAAR
jgi:L-ascorbate metabolism protein UlaG (beta-lactamase superfamily)